MRYYGLIEGGQLPVWICWIFVLAALLWLGSIYRQRRLRLAALVNSEDGAAYSLSLAITTPFYALLVCFLIELTLMLNVQIGVERAAFAAARSAIVWLPAEVTPLSSQDQLIDMVQLSAIQALTPYAPSSDKFQRAEGSSATQNYLAAYRQFAMNGGSQSDDYVSSKFDYAAAGTRIEFSPPLSSLLNGEAGGNDEVTVTVTYEMPFHTPGVGRILGQRSSFGNGYVRLLTASTTLQIERPKTQNGMLGFDYDSRPAGSPDGTSSDDPSDDSPTDQLDANALLDLIAAMELELQSETDPARIRQLLENLQDARIALEVALFGESPTADRLWQEYLDSLKEPKKEKQRYFGFSITGKLAAGPGELSGTEVFLYDCKKRVFHKYSGGGLAGGGGAFAGFVVRPIVIDATDPRDLDSFSVEGTAIAAFFVGGEFSVSGTVNNDFSDLKGDWNTGFVVGIGAGGSAGGGLVRYRGTRNTFFLRLIRHILWAGESCG